MRIAALIILGGLLACGADKTISDGKRSAETPLTSQNPGVGSFRVELEKRYGFCLGDCTFKLSVGEDGAAVAEVVNKDGQSRTRPFTLTAAELESVRTGVSTALTKPWEPRYGCPDCADQGAWTLNLTSGSNKRSSVVDPQDKPTHLAPLLDTLDALENANRP